MDALDLELHLVAQLLVERAERLVHQDDRRAVDEAARERDALLLAAGQLARIALRQMRQPHHLERLGRRGLRICAASTFRIFSGKAMFSSTVMCGNSA